VVRGGFVEQQSVTKNIAMIIINLVTTKAAAKQELLFYKAALGLEC
jgi:hypothetical protein